MISQKFVLFVVARLREIIMKLFLFWETIPNIFILSGSGAFENDAVFVRIQANTVFANGQSVQNFDFKRAMWYGQACSTGFSHGGILHPQWGAGSVSHQGGSTASLQLPEVSIQCCISCRKV